MPRASDKASQEVYFNSSPSGNQSGPEAVRMSISDGNGSQGQSVNSTDTAEQGDLSISPGRPPEQSSFNATVQAAGPAPEFGWGGYFQAIGLLFLILAVLLAAFILLRRFGARAGLGGLSRGELKLEAQLGIGPKKSVVVVRFLNSRLVLGVSESQINLLTKMDDDDADDQICQTGQNPGQRRRIS